MHLHGSPWRGARINPYIWCAVGAVIGVTAGFFMGGGTRVTRIEEVLVAVFGAFFGGEFVSAMLNAGKAPTTFTASGLLYAALGAIALLLLLGLMRRAVGPMRSHRKPTRGSR